MLSCSVLCFILPCAGTGHGTPSATGTQNQSIVAIARRNIRKINGKFSMLVTKSCKRLQSKNIDIEVFQMFLITMYSSPSSRDGSVMITTVIDSANTLDKIFRTLSEHGFWDYLNYYLLQDIIEEFTSDDDELNNMMEQYQKDLTGYVLTLEIQKYLEATHNKHPITVSDSENSGDETVSPQKKQLFEELSIKVDANVTDHTIGYVYDLWRSLRNQFKLPRPAMILHSIAEGCICITWLIPANLVTHVTRMVQETANMFAKLHILKVMLWEHCIYPMETELETEHPLLEPEPSLPETKPPPFESEMAALNRKVCYLHWCIQFFSFCEHAGSVHMCGVYFRGGNLVPKLSCMGDMCCNLFARMLSSPMIWKFY